MATPMQENADMLVIQAMLVHTNLTTTKLSRRVPITCFAASIPSRLPLHT